MTAKTAKLYSLPAFKVGKREGLTKGAAVVFARHVATEMDQDGMLDAGPTPEAEAVARATGTDIHTAQAAVNAAAKNGIRPVVETAVAKEPEVFADMLNKHGIHPDRQPEHPLVHDLGKPYGYFVGEKYERLDVAEIAKLVRTEIKDLVKKGKLPTAKYGVTISRFAGGRSMSIRVRDLPGTFPLLNPERVLIESREPHTFHPDFHYPRYTPEGRAMLDTLKAIADAYRYDRSDSMTDYFDTNFYLHVDVDHDVETAARAAILAKAAV